MASGGNSRQAPQQPQGAAAQPQGFPGQQPPPGAYGQPPAGFPPPGGQPGGYPGYPGYFPPMGYPPYGYPPPQPPPQQTRQDPTRTRQRTTRAATQEEEAAEEDEEDEDAETEYLESDEESEPESVESIDIDDMYRKFRKFANKEEDIDRRFGMRRQIREASSPYEKKSCTCVPRPTGGFLPMIYESKRCICGYGTEKMMKDLRKPVRMLWSPTEEHFVDDTVKNFNRIEVSKVKFPTIPGTAPAPTELRTKALTKLRTKPGTSNGRDAVRIIPKGRVVDRLQVKNVPNKKIQPAQLQSSDPFDEDNFEPEFKDSILRSGKFYDAKLGRAVEYRILDAGNNVIGKKKLA